jgi:hypothetical protein
MFPFWDDIVAPVIEAVGAKRIVEIGALRGDQTELMLQRLGPDVELHVIDPLPFFDPAEHERRFAGRYVFHRDLSVNVLRELPALDVALIDGDHNWYTVFTELNLLADAARGAGEPMPVMVLHDVGWPYGRRDLYYDPSNIPEEHRRPWRRAGLRRGQRQLLAGGGGLNSTLANAEIEGGPRNGVMTAVEDFVAAHDKPLRLVVLPILFGLAIVVEEERLAAQPSLAATLDRLESREGKDMLLRLAEDFRVDSLTLDHALLEQAGDRVAALASRYLETIKRAIAGVTTIDTPAGYEAPQRQRAATSARAGLDHLHGCLDAVWSPFVRGDIAVAGVGPSALFVAAYLEAHDHESRYTLWIAGPDPAGDDSVARDHARDLLDRFDLLSDRIRFLPGDVEKSPSDATPSRLALINLGAGGGANARSAVDLLYPHLAPGGIVAIDDLLDATTCAAAEDFRASHGIRAPLERFGRRHAHWRK